MASRLKYNIHTLEKGGMQQVEISQQNARCAANDYGKRFGMLFLVHLYGDKVFIKRVR